jgi:anaerobic selenocysteine-containing dehydrogenase
MLNEQPYPIKGMISVASNPLVNFPNTKLVYEALKRLDLHVVMDLFMTPTCQLADYVLPAASWLERPMFWSFADINPAVDIGEAALPPEYERRTEYDFWRGLGLRLGQEAYWPWETLEEAIDYRLAPLGYNLKSLVSEKGGSHYTRVEDKKYAKTGFATPTGKVELYSTILEKLGHDPLPRYEESSESPISTPQLAEEYPLILITGGRTLQYVHSQGRQVEKLRKKYPQPTMQINPAKATELGISDGDWVWIETPAGRVKQKCKYFQGIDPRVVHAEHGWWFPEKPGEEPSLYGMWESNINVVINDNPTSWDKVSGGWVLRGLLCRVYKAQEEMR